MGVSITLENGGDIDFIDFRSLFGEFYNYILRGGSLELEVAIKFPASLRIFLISLLKFIFSPLLVGVNIRLFVSAGVSN